MRIVTFQAILSRIVFVKINLIYSIFFLCCIKNMTSPAEFPPAGPYVPCSISFFSVLCPGAMTCFAVDVTMNISSLQILYILMTFKTRFLSGVMNREKFIILH